MPRLATLSTYGVLPLSLTLRLATRPLGKHPVNLSLHAGFLAFLFLAAADALLAHVHFVEVQSHAAPFAAADFLTLEPRV
jgi:hypothetical protein